MNAFEKYAAKLKLTKLLKRKIPTSMKAALAIPPALLALMWADPGGKISGLHKKVGKKYPVHVRKVK
jgi:hypothetical protein